MMVELGKRLERLLFFTAPITIAAFLVLAVALASIQSSVLSDARCYSLGASIVSEQLPRFEAAWKESVSEKRAGRTGNEYEVAQLLMLTYPEVPIECYGVLRPDNDGLVKKSPADLLSWLEAQSEVAAKAPLEMYGVALPRSTNIELLGNVIQVELVAFSRILQIVMFPVLVLWLASLHQTRHRESLYIADANSLRDVYPHFMNVYPLGPKSGVKRKALRYSALSAGLERLFLAIWRAGLIALFVVPASVAYITSVLLTTTDPDDGWWILMLGTVGMAIIIALTMSVVLFEFSAKLYFRSFVTRYDPGES